MTASEHDHAMGRAERRAMREMWERHEEAERQAAGWVRVNGIAEGDPNYHPLIAGFIAGFAIGDAYRALDYRRAMYRNALISFGLAAICLTAIIASWVLRALG